MYFSYFLNYAPPKPSKMDNSRKIMNFFGNWISKCTYLMKKRTHVSAYMLLSSLSNKQIVCINSRRTPCISWYGNIHHPTPTTDMPNTHTTWIQCLNNLCANGYIPLLTYQDIDKICLNVTALSIMN